MEWSNFVSATSTFAGAAPWFNAFFDEARFFLYSGTGIAMAGALIVILVAIFYRALGRLTNKQILFEERARWHIPDGHGGRKLGTFSDYTDYVRNKSENWRN